MGKSVFIFAALGFVAFANESRAVTISEAMAAADSFYMKGDCPNAVRIYRGVYYTGHESNYDEDLIRFRTAYCYLNSNQLEAAIEGFQAFLKRHPDSDEARLRLAQAQFQSKNFRAAEASALMVTDSQYRPEAALVAAQAALELGDTEGAVTTLTQIRVNDNWRPIFAYWLGVAKYRLNNLSAAGSYFQLAASLAAPDNWVRGEAINWLEQIRSDTPFHGAAVLGFIYDSNLAQQSVLTADSSGVPTQKAPQISSYYGDTAYYLGLEFSYRFLREQRWTLTGFTSANASMYEEYDAYRSQNISAGVNATYEITPRIVAGAALKYLDSRYNYKFYQDYLTFDPSVWFGLLDNFSLNFNFPVTYYLNSSSRHTFGPALSARYISSWGSVFGGFSYTKAKGPKATYYSVSSLAYVDTGTMFTTYSTVGAFLGTTVNLPWDLFATAQASSYNTTYDKEDLPVSSLQYAYSNRDDNLVTFGLELSKVVIPNTWSFSLSYNYSVNKSYGLQGLASSNYVTDYTYNRHYAMFSSTVNF